MKLWCKKACDKVTHCPHFCSWLFAEGLSGLMKQATDLGKFYPFKAGSDVRISLLQYADDTLFIGEENWDNLWLLKMVLRSFELASGLKINFHKSSIIGANVDERFLHGSSNFLNCSIRHIPFKFLGLPTGANPRRAATWSPVIELIRSWLAGWKGKNLSLGGRIVLVNSILSSLPLYFFSFYRVPKIVLRQLVRLQRSFLWSGWEEGHKVAWVRWEEVCQPKEKRSGVWGVKNLNLFNISLLAKWRWRFLTDHSAIWGKVASESVWGNKA